MDLLLDQDLVSVALLAVADLDTLVIHIEVTMMVHYTSIIAYIISIIISRIL